MTKNGLSASADLSRNKTINLGIDYKTVKFIHIDDKYIYMYALPLKNYAVVQYEADDDTIAFSQFFWDYTDALHCFNLLRKEKD